MGKLRVELDGVSHGFDAMMTRAKAEVRSFSQSWSAASLGKNFASGVFGGFASVLSFEGVKSFLQDIIHTGKEIKELSDQFDISTDSLQQWQQALRGASISEGVFFRSLETLRSNRAEAIKDPEKMQSLFGSIGLAEAAGSGMNDEQLMRLVLKSNASRLQLRQIGGPGLSRLREINPENQTPMLGNRDIKDISEIDSYYTQAKGFIKRMVVGNISDALHPGRKGFAGALASMLIPGGSVFAANTHSTKEEDARDAAKDEEEKKAEIQAIEAQAHSERLKILETQQRQLSEAHERNLSPEEQRAAKQKRLDELNAKIAEREQNLGVENSPAGDLNRIDLNKMLIQREGMISDLAGGFGGKSGKASFHVEALAKAGLYSSASLNFNPALGVNDTVPLLRQIAGNTARMANKTDPHAQ